MRGRLASIQAQQVEVGRIRMGTSIPKTSRAGKAYNEPVKLERFRLTSRSRQLLETAAGLYGGEVSGWTPQNSTVEQYELHIEKDWLSVIVPPDPCSQYFEMWDRGKCARRCDGVMELLSDAPCLCGPDPDRRQCKPYTRLALMLADMPGIGVWRLETHGYYAAAELPAVADLLSKAGGNVAARLEMEQRQQSVEVNGKSTTALFYVPVLHVEATPAQLLAVLGSGGRPAAIGVGSDDDEPPAIEAAPRAVQAAPVSAVPVSAPPEDVVPPQPDLVGRILVAIKQAADKNRMLSIKAQIEKTVLNDADRLTVAGAWTERAQGMASGQAPAPPAPPPAAQPVPQPPPPASAPAAAVDRQAVFRDINTWAGYKNITLSGLAVLYREYARDDTAELRAADGNSLYEFKCWLEANK